MYYHEILILILNLLLQAMTHLQISDMKSSINQVVSKPNILMAFEITFFKPHSETDELATYSPPSPFKPKGFNSGPMFSIDDILP